MLILYIIALIFLCLLLFWASSWMIEALMRIARYLQWQEFVVAFFIMAFAASVPNLFVGISSALHQIPELSFGDIIGGNLIDLTVVLGLATLIAKELPAKSKIIQTSALFTIVVAILPLVLIWDGTLGRGDGLILISSFIFYIGWLFGKKERFSKTYEEEEVPPVIGFKHFLKDLGKITLGITILIFAAEGIVRTASYFAESLNLSLPLIGILIVSMGNALPEAYFAIVSARKGKTWLILGDLMGSVIIPATLVLGIVSLITPIVIVDFSPFVIGRFFMIAAALLFLLFISSGKKVTRKEAVVLLGLYIFFIICELSAR
ncbi:MAG: sodium:calcium antiporter [bacterium]